MQKLKKDHIVLVFIILIIFSVFQYGIQKIYGFTLYPDEFGYWASAANAVGYDWSETASMGSYYSYGYSLILIPVLKLFSGGVRAYRAALAVNMLLMCAGVLLLWKISLKVFPQMEKTKREFACGVGVLYPAWIFYMQTTMSEALLNFLFILIIYLFLIFIENPRAVTAMLLAVTLIYIYSVHMRTVGLVIACMMTCVLWSFTKSGSRKQLLIFVMVLMAAGFELPSNVHGIIADCGYTSPHAIWKHVVENNLRLYYDDMMSSIADEMCRAKIQIGSKDYSCPDALAECKVPVLFIHGTDDDFVPVEMTYENYKACTSQKRLLIVPGAGHGMSYVIDRKSYEQEVKRFWKDFD